MAQKRTEERRTEASFQMGKANAALIPRLERWCSHLKVELVSSGLYAQMSGLPIGMMQIVCPHADKGMQAMDLKRVAAYFVEQNCRGCPYHEELNPDNAGREILRESEQVREERAAAAEASKESSAKVRLHGLVSGDLSAALRVASTTEQSVLELVALLDNETHAGDASEKLRQAAALAPDFFTDLACEVISEHFADILGGGKCAETIRIIGVKRGHLPEVAVKAALRCVMLPFCHDEVIALLADHFAAGGELPPAAVVARIIGHQAYGSDNFMSRGEKSYPGQTQALCTIGQRNLSRLAEAFERLLENPEKQVRIGATMTLRKILPKLSDLGSALTDPLIASLQLDDDRYGRSADVEATRALADIFTNDPASTEARLKPAFRRADEEVQELLFRVYRSVVEAARARGDGESVPVKAIGSLPVVLDILIPATTAADLPLEVRKDAAETIASIARDHAKIALSRMDSLFGALAIVSREEVEFVEASPGGNPVIRGLPRTERLAYDAICHHLLKALKELAEDSPAGVWTTLFALLNTLRSSDSAEAALKAKLLPLFVPLAKGHATAPLLVPELFKAIMDMESVLVRVVALDVVKDFLRRNPELVPDNMREMLVIYLRDMYVAVHKAAARAVRFMPMTTKGQAEQVAQSLFAQFHIYSTEQPDPAHCRELVDSLVAACRGFTDLQKNYALLALLKQCEDAERHVAREAMTKFLEMTRDETAFAILYVHELLRYLSRFPGEGDDHWPYSQEHELLLSLYEFPTTLIVGDLAEFTTTISAAAKIDPYAALQLISALLHHEQFGPAAEAAVAIAQALPTGAQHDGLRQQAELTAALAKAELHIMSGDVAAALAELKAAAPVLSDYDAHTHPNEPNTFIEAFSVADSVAGRLG